MFKPTVYSDNRGYFFENFRQSHLRENGIDLDFVQENESMSNKGIVRGLHLQAPPHAQAKLLRVVTGSILDVVVDLRTASPTYRASYAVELSEVNKRSLFVPEGFAHGFCCLEDNTIVQYKCSDYYNPESEMGIKWNDVTLGIEWPIESPIVSEKDEALPLLSDFHSPF